MKNTVKIISLILAVLCMLPVLAACKPGDEGQTPSKASITLASGGTCNYTVVRPELCSDKAIKAAVSIVSALEEATGASVKIKEDFLMEGTAPEQYEILVGQTNREESAKALDSIKYNDYTVVIDGSKLVINAYTDEKLIEAVDHVLSFIKGKTDGNVVFTDADQKTVRAEYANETVKIAGIDVKGYSIVVPKSTGSFMKASGEALQKQILDACGIYLPIIIDTAAPTEKEILLGNTNRPESKAVDATTLGTYGYSVSASGSKIVIVTSDKNFTLMNIAKVIGNEIKSGSMEAKTGNIEISDKPILTSFMFTDVHNNFAMLEPTNNYKKYIVRKNVDLAIDTLLDTVGPVDVVLVGGDLMSDYHSWVNSGYWPYGYFVEYRALLVETFKRLSKDGKVSYVAGNHDYAQGEKAAEALYVKDGYAAAAPHTPTGNYNSCDFYFGDVGMRQDWGELPEEDMFWKVGEKTGDKYLLAYYYEVNGIGFVGLSADPDHPGVWSVQGSGFDDDCLEWLDKKLDEVDPYGNKVIFINCHYFFNHRTKIEADGTNRYSTVDYDKKSLTPIYKGHKNLYHIFGHGEVWYSDTTSRYVSHHNTNGMVIDVTGTETNSSQIVDYANRDFTLIYGGHFRPDANAYPQWFKMDKVVGFAGTSSPTFTHRSTATPRVGQGLYIEVFEDRIVFTMKNFGDYPGFSTDDLITPYTVWLYK